MTNVDELSDRYVEVFAELDPCASSLMGITGHDGALTDYSPEGFDARDALNRRTLADLAALPDPAGDRGPAGDGAARARLAARLLREHLEREIACHEAGVTTSGLAAIDSSIPALRRSIELLDRGPATPWPDLLSRLRALPDSLAGLRATLTRDRQLGRVAALRQVLSTAVQCERTAGYLPRLAAAHGDGPLREPLGEAVAAGARALTDFTDFLRDELAAHAPRRDALGRDRYQLGVQYYLGTALDLDDTYAWGWTELAAIEAEMSAVAGEITQGATVAEVTEALDNDPGRRLVGADEVRDYLQQLADRAIAELDGVHFDIPEPLRRIECRITPTTIGGVSYLPPAEDFTRPGQVWWTLPGDELPTWTVPSTMYHEGAPGHHLQQGTVMCRADLFNRFQRAATEWSFSGHVEGWGLYAERLMGELGYYADPADRLGMLTQHRFRAARVVLDIGMHLELEIPRGSGFHDGERWTPDLGREFLRARSGLDDFTVRFEIDRYLGRPGQAAAYKVGERVWLTARADARRRLGAAFDLRAFHAAALDLGTMGLDAFRDELARLLAVGAGGAE
ncbi:MAG TPA: DUF885 domain-containing protein [Streptosporangiaceae bacterium]